MRNWSENYRLQNCNFLLEKNERSVILRRITKPFDEIKKLRNSNCKSLEKFADTLNILVNDQNFDRKTFRFWTFWFRKAKKSKAKKVKKKLK